MLQIFIGLKIFIHSFLKTFKKFKYNNVIQIRLGNYI